MKQIKNILLVSILLLIVSSCQQLDDLPLSDQNTITSLKYFVYQGGDLGKKVEYNITNIAPNMIINPTETSENLRYTRIEAIIPATATIVEKDAYGTVIGNMSGMRNVNRKTYIFCVVAANGNERQYKMVFK